MRYLQDFQRKQGLKDDGVLGRITFNKMREVFKLNGTELAHFLGQCDHETSGFRFGEENLNYSAAALLRTFPRYFTKIEAKEYERQPERIANRVYANRMGNGDEESGDGWKYKGRGSVQLTGFNNYERFGNRIKNLCVIDQPDIVRTDYYFEVGLYFFNENNLWKFCQEITDSNILKLSRAINIGNPNSTATPNGLQDRINKTYHYQKLI
jgi:putative chitinase